MLPVTISLGLINFNMLINSLFGSLVSNEAPAAIDKAFRIYQLPQGIFSVAIATVLFPTLARFANAGEIDNLRATMANGMRQILFVLVPAAAAILALSDPMIRLIYQRGEFGPEETLIVGTALFWFAFSLPTNGLYLLQTRTFFSLQRPWQATGLATIDLVVSALAAFALYKPFGIGGIVAGTGIGTTVAVVAQAVILRREFGGLELGRLFSTTLRITIASAALAGVSWLVWDQVDERRRAWPRRPDPLARRRPRRRRRRLRRRGAPAADRRARPDPAAGAAAAGLAERLADARSWSLPAGRGRDRGARRLRGGGGLAGEALAGAGAAGRGWRAGDGGPGAGAADLVRGGCSGRSGPGSRCRTCSSSLPWAWGPGGWHRGEEEVSRTPTCK